jgi:hypothetical protein
MQPAQSPTAQSPIIIPPINLPIPYSPEIASLDRYEEEMAHLLEGKIRPDLRRTIIRTFNEIHLFLVLNARFRGKFAPQQENLILLKTEALIDHIRSLGKPVPEALFEVQARYRVRSGFDHFAFKQRYKEVQALFCDHNINMELLKTSKSKFDTKCTQIGARAIDILARVSALATEARSRALAKRLREIEQQVGDDLPLIMARKRLQQRSSTVLCSPSPLTTAAPSFRNSNSLENTRTLLNCTGVTIPTISADSD